MRRREKGFTLIEILVVATIIAMVATIAIPSLRRSKLSANEAASIGALRTLSTAQENFHSTSGFNTYADMADLVGTAPPYIDDALAAGKTPGYIVAVIDSTPESWAALAVPNLYGSTGNRSFYIDQSGVIRFTADGSVPTNADPPVTN